MRSHSHWTESGYAVCVAVLGDRAAFREIPLEDLRMAYQAHQALQFTAAALRGSAFTITLQQRIQGYFGVPSRDALEISRGLRSRFDVPEPAHPSLPSATGVWMSDGEGVLDQ